MKDQIKNTVKRVLLLTFIISFTNSYAQKSKISYDNDTIKVDGKPYAIMKKKNVGSLRNDYAVSSLSNVELLYFKTELHKYSPYRGWMFGGNPFMYGKDELYYKVAFIGTGSEANLRHQNAKGFAKMIVESNLIKDNLIDPVSEKRFILLNNGHTPEQNKTAVDISVNQTSDPIAVTTAPSTSKSKSPVVIAGNQILRDGNTIGKFRQDTTSSAYVQKVLIVTVYSEAGEKVAEASVPLAKPLEWSVKIQSNSKIVTVMYDAPDEREKLFRWLADKNYLAN